MFRVRCRTATIGLDLGNHTVRAVQVTASSDARAVYRVTRCDRRGLGHDAPRPPRPASEAVRQCLQGADFRGRRVSTALDSPDIEIHALELPAAVSGQRPDELAGAIHWEIERLASHMGAEVETRHWLLPPTSASAPNAIGAAVRRGTVMETVDACAHAGWTCIRIDAAAAALCRFGHRLHQWSPDIVWGLLDLGHRHTRLVLCVDDVPVLVRDAGAGGSGWTQRIADALQISAKAAEVQKRDIGLALTGRGLRPDVASVPTTELGSILTGILRSDLHEIAGEVKRSYEYVLSCYPGRQAADLILVGGGAATHNLPEYLTSALGIGVHRASVYLERESCRWHPSLGEPNRLEDFALALGLTIPS